jgi:hypothetical protein
VVLFHAFDGHAERSRGLGETYTTKRRCFEGIESVKRLAADAPVEDDANTA